MVRELHAFDDDKVKSVKSSKVNITPDFYAMTYDGPFKEVFSIKRILAVIIKETIDLYELCTLDDIVGLIESVDPIVDVKHDYGTLIPVYSIWITLVGKTTDAANKVLRYSLKNTGYNHADSPDSFIGRMDAVTDLLNIYLVCIDKSIFESKVVEDGLEPVVEFVSLLFSG